jgi:hypothetical protein
MYFNKSFFFQVFLQILIENENPEVILIMKKYIQTLQTSTHVTKKFLKNAKQPLYVHTFLIQKDFKPIITILENLLLM